MDPFAAAFAAYLNTFSTTVTNSLRAQKDLDVKAHVVEYGEHTITYQHRMWEIQSDSVCADVRQDLQTYSGCTAAALEWFRAACRHLSDNPTNHWSQSKMKSMYCGAAVSFRPTIASIEWSPSQQPDALQAAREACSLARVAVLGDNTAEQRRQKAEACGRYEKLKGQPSHADHE